MKRRIQFFSGLCLVLVLTASCIPGMFTPQWVRQEGGGYLLVKKGLYRCGPECRKMSASDGLTAGSVRTVVGSPGQNGEVWAVYPPDARAGATRLAPAPVITLTSKDGLLDDRVACVAATGSDREVFAYDRKLDLGLSVRDPEGWRHYNKLNSPLRSGKISSLVPDMSGGVWVLFAESRMGTARLWGLTLTAFDTINSQLPTNDIDRIVPEPAGQGLPGDNAWFVTVDGLTRYDLSAGVWKHYGRQHQPTGDLFKIMGMDQWFSEAIVNIQDLCFDEGSVWISTPSRVYRFDGNQFSSVTASFVEGLDPLRFSSILRRNGTLWAVIRNLNSRTAVEIASYTVNAGWKRYPLSRYGVNGPQYHVLAEGREGPLLLGEEWEGRVLRYEPSADTFVIQNLP